MSEKMHTREAVETIILGRGKERIVINPGQVFEFTKEELDQISPDAVSAESVVNLDDPNGIDMKKVNKKVKANQTNAPVSKGDSDNKGDGKADDL